MNKNLNYIKAKHNPFSSSRVEALKPRLSSWRELIKTIEKSKVRGTIVGPEGSGKTTLVHSLISYYKKNVIRTVYFRAENFNFRKLQGQPAIIFCDGADSLNFWQWIYLKFHTFFFHKGLILTAHKSGKLKTIYNSKTSPKLLLNLLDELLGHNSENQVKLFAVRSYKKHRGDIRKVFRDCYQAYANDFFETQKNNNKEYKPAVQV